MRLLLQLRPHRKSRRNPDDITHPHCSVKFSLDLFVCCILHYGNTNSPSNVESSIFRKMAEADNLAAFVKLYSCMFSVWGLRRVRPFACGRHSPPSTFHPYSLSLLHSVFEQSTE